MERKRLLFASVATIVVLAPLAWFWQASLIPGTYSVMDMGYLDYGGGSRSSAGHDGQHSMSLRDLVETTDRPADLVVNLSAQRKMFEVSTGHPFDGYTLNDRSPGPAITAHVGELVEVHLRNTNVDDGITLHWHGVDVPNAEDGVAGVTQNAVGPGQKHTYRFVVDQVGTYWYHSHQVSHKQVARGLFGALVVLPADGVGEDRDVTALAHTYAGTRTINGVAKDLHVDAAQGQKVRVRAINTDIGAMQVWSDSEYRVAAIDGRDLNKPTPVSGEALTVTAGGRADLVVTSPARVQIGGATAMLIGPSDAGVPKKPVQPTKRLDLLSYGSGAPISFDPTHADRKFTYSVGRRPGFIDGRPGVWWTINGHLFPDVPMFVVREGEVIVMHIENHTGDAHPMHLHGHHAVVLSRDGKRSSGSPWWTDSLDVESGERYDIAFVANNPGLWMDHCHNLVHAAQGLVAHLMYEGVTTPYKVGGHSKNSPE
ncbi:MAG: multicopper oxidase family protein [Aeromicrobium sp.]